jgi:4'-phosphopantetheinyl transferase
MNLFKKNTEIIVHGSPDERVHDFSCVHVWFCDLDDGLHLDLTSRSLLSVSQRNRALRLKNISDRQRFVTRCAIVNHVIGSISGIAPETLTFQTGPNGKPELVFPDGFDRPVVGLNFNLSHSENILALAVAFNREVGIDIERMNPEVDFLGIAEAHFAAKEFDWLRATPQKKRAISFYRLWTRKEALLKMAGSGIASELTPEILTDPEWTLYSLEFKFDEKEIVGALALGGEVVRDCELPATLTAETF